MIDKETIRKNFSKYAQHYDRYSTIQNLCALRLIDMVKTDGFKKIMDIGCGTGNYTGLLRDRFPTAQIKAIDISKEMIEIAKDKLHNKLIEFIIEDAETINFKEPFDLISSNASFQWFEDLEKALFRYKGLLNKNGLIQFSIFGPFTFYELGESLKKLFGKNIRINASDFIGKEEIKKILRPLFSKIKIEEQIYKERYDTILDLLKTIKYTGARGNGLIKINFWTPETIYKIEKIYKEEFKEIPATYQVFFCKGRK